MIPPVIKRNSLINGRIEMMNCSDQNYENESHLDDKTQYLEERNLLDERFCGITCENISYRYNFLTFHMF